MSKKISTIAVVLIFALIIGACVVSLVIPHVKEKNDDEAFASLSSKVSAVVNDTQKSSNKSSSKTSTQTEASQQPTHSVEELLGMNNECYAWISIKDTRIDYPVMHTPNDPDKYLNKNFYGEYSSSGVPYMDARCSDDSDNKIVFGHHMDYGSMFSDLCNYTSRMFRDTHQDILFETHTAKESYKVFAVLRVKADDYWYNFIDAETAKKFDKKISYAKEHSLYKTNITPEFGQKLLTLSTCMGSNRDDRLIVIAVKNQK